MNGFRGHAKGSVAAKSFPLKFAALIAVLLLLITAFITVAIRLSRGTTQGRPTVTRIVGWGFNRSGAATGVPTPNRATGVVTFANVTLTNVTAIAAGNDYSLALKADGTVMGWGNNWRSRALGYDAGRVNPTNGLVMIGGQLLTNAVAICASGQSAALTHDGSAVTWGLDSFGPNGHVFRGPHFVSNVVAIASGGDNVAAAMNDGVVESWGEGYQAPENLKDAIAVALSSSFLGHGIALRSNHSVYAWGLWHTSSCQVGGATNVIAIAAGVEHYVALKNDGTVIEWGNYAPAIAGSALSGWPATDLVSHHAIIGGRVLSNVIAIAAGGTRSMALKRDGTVVVWGTDWSHQSEVPVQLDVPAGLKGVVAIAAGYGHLLAVTTNDPPLPATK